jgi:hypothetical protein
MKQAQGDLKEKRNGGAQAARPEEPETQPQADGPPLLPTTPAREPQERPKEPADQQKAGEMFAMPLALPNRSRPEAAWIFHSCTRQPGP